jgi:hypothetical protein
MAVALPPDMQKVPPAVIPVIAEWRLPSNHAQDLRDVARGLEESDVGIRTRYLVDRDAAEGEDRDDDYVHMYELEAFCNRFGIIGPWSNAGRSRIRRCRAALRRLSRAGDCAAVGVLHVFYGYPDPSVRQWPRQAADALGDLAPLLRYTDATETVRKGLVSESTLRTEIAGGFDPRTPVAGLRPLALVVAAAGVGERERFFDRVISSGDAIHAALRPFGEALRPRGINEHPEIHKARCRAFKERFAAHAARRQAYLDAGRADAAALLTRASRAFHVAWLQASGD